MGIDFDFSYDKTFWAYCVLYALLFSELQLIFSTNWLYFCTTKLNISTLFITKISTFYRQLNCDYAAKCYLLFMTIWYFHPLNFQSIFHRLKLLHKNRKRNVNNLLYLILLTNFYSSCKKTYCMWLIFQFSRCIFSFKYIQVVFCIHYLFCYINPQAMSLMITLVLYSETSGLVLVCPFYWNITRLWD